MEVKLTGISINEKIYEGPRTLVYRGIRDADDQKVAIKLMRNQYPSMTELVQFRNQYAMSKNLDLPGIVKSLSLENYGNGYALVMEDTGGISLNKASASFKPIDLDTGLKIGIQLAEILHGLYQNRIIHKDLKPANILIHPDTKEVKLIDFSIASLLPREAIEIQNPNQLEGTLAYISPEQTGRMNRGIDYRSDFYSLGVTLYELWAGELPFRSDDSMELVHCHLSKEPPALGNRGEAIPAVLSDIVLKLMAKNAEERYQSALGLKLDLEKCLSMWQEIGSIEPFELGERDISDRFNIPEKLYGRETEVKTLLDAFDRVASGTTEMMLVAGFSGIGKTALVNEVHKPIVRARGYFIKGKFDQFQRNIPFRALVIAFRDLMEQLLGESDAQLESWKTSIVNALGENAQVIIEVIPELERIIGKQAPASELSGSAAQNRFNLLFQKFIRVFTTKEHPLVIFLDDLQWADSASLKLMQLLMGEVETGYLLLLGAYRDVARPGKFSGSVPRPDVARPGKVNDSDVAFAEGPEVDSGSDVALASRQRVVALASRQRNEVFPTHPLMLTLDEIAKSGATLNTITLAPLNEMHLNRLVAETLHCELQLALPLTELVYQKTKGNPFFATQFLKSLHEDGWIAFNFDVGHWQCDMTRVRELALSDDVVEFMATRLHKLPESTRELLKLAACIGNQFDLETLAIVSERSFVEAAKDLWFALQEGLILPLSETYKFYQQEDSNSQLSGQTNIHSVGSPLFSGGGGGIPHSQLSGQTNIHSVGSPLFSGGGGGIPHSPFPNYKFLHDRVQQAAYSLIPENRFLALGEGNCFLARGSGNIAVANLAWPSDKISTHYRIGQLLLQETALEAREERIFEIINQLNHGTALITEQTEREELAKLNLIACRKARAATAYQAGREYASTGLSLLGENAWQRQYDMSLAFHDLAAELASLCGDFEAMERFVETVIAQARTLLEKVNVYRIKIQANVSQNQATEAIAIGQQLLQQFGVTFPATPTEKDIRDSIAEISELIGDREIENLVNLPIMTDGTKIAIVEIANSIMPAAYLSGSPLYALIVALYVKLSIQYGNTSVSALAYNAYGLIACVRWQDVDTGVKFGELSLQVVSKLDAKAVRSAVLNGTGLFLLHRKSHIKKTLQFLQEGYTAALEVGNLEYAGYAAQGFCFHSLWCGQPLATLELENRAYYNGLVQLNQSIAANWRRIDWQLILNLLGFAAEHPSILSGETLVEAEFLPLLTSASDLYGLFLFYSCKLVLCYLFGEIESARDSAVEVKRYLVAGSGTFAEPVFYFYDSLTAIAQLSCRFEETVLHQVEENQTCLQQQWASHAPMNHQHKVDLVAAEKCRVKGQKTEAIELYDKAIKGAKENEFIQEEALANELAAKFYLEWGKKKIARTYLVDAYYCYARWGAKAKVEDLETRYPQLLAPILEGQKLDLTLSQTFATMTAGTVTQSNTGMGEILDLAALMKASRALSEDIELKGAIANLMQVARENAGAETVALMLFEKQVLMLSARIAGEEVPKIDPIPVEGSHAVPLSIVNKVKRSRKPLVLKNASEQSVFAGDAYIRSSQPKSILCLPLIDRSQLIGILYLENNRVAGAFTSDRVEVLSLLCSQAAICLENARLYEDARNYAQQLEDTQLQLVQSEKMASLGQLVSGVAHEINNPVGFLSGNLDCATEYLEDLIDLLQLYQQGLAHHNETIQNKIEEIDLDYLLEDFPELISSMKKGTDRIAEISKSMRTFSRSDTAAKIPFNIHDGIESTLLILKHRLKANKKRPAIEVVKNYGELPEVNCYPGQLNQVFMNLIANAIDAMEEANEGKNDREIIANPNRITITTVIDEDKQETIIQIGDNGPGMPEEVKEKIFDRLFTTKGVGKGTGLGLSISRQIVEEKHGGKITLSSEVGRGTEFGIALPLS